MSIMSLESKGALTDAEVQQLRDLLAALASRRELGAFSNPDGSENDKARAARAALAGSLCIAVVRLMNEVHPVELRDSVAVAAMVVADGLPRGEKRMPASFACVDAFARFLAHHAFLG